MADLVERLRKQADNEPAGIDTFYRRLFTAAADRIAALEAQLAMKVKPLEWSELSDHEPGWWVAENESLGIGYEVRVNSRDIVRVRFPRKTWETFDGTTDEAKAAAQADFARRILSALEATPPAPKVTEEMVDRACAAFEARPGLLTVSREAMRSALTAALSGDAP